MVVRISSTSEEHDSCFRGLPFAVWAQTHNLTTPRLMICRLGPAPPTPLLASGVVGGSALQLPWTFLVQILWQRQEMIERPVLMFSSSEGWLVFEAHYSP